MTMQPARLSALSDGQEPGFGVYVHWPFCAAKCPYCDFNSHVRHQPVDQARFVSAFLKEMDAALSLSGPRTVTSIFIGGGTPSLMAPETVGALLDGIAGRWSVPDGIEVTIEANPRASRPSASAAIAPPASTAFPWACRR